VLDLASELTILAIFMKMKPHDPTLTCLGLKGLVVVGPERLVYISFIPCQLSFSCLSVLQ
jgi:hypothetical protein